jgi:dsRNA-specific ribonuclease
VLIISISALLTLGNARGYLAHFCATLTAPLAEKNPEFVMIEGPDGMVSARVLLPNVLDSQFREFYGRSKWKTQMMARRDASFQAYAKLYEAGFVDDNLLPVHKRDAEAEIDKRSAFVEAGPTMNPWARVAAKWQEVSMLYKATVEISAHDHAFSGITMVLPVTLPCDITFDLFWNEETTLTVSLRSDANEFPLDLVEPAAAATHIILSSAFSARMPGDQKDFPFLILPDLEDITADSILEWCESVKGTVAASSVTDYATAPAKTLGLVRRLNRFFKFDKVLVPERSLMMKRVVVDEKNGEGAKVAEADLPEEPHVEGPAWPKRTDFLHPVTGKAKTAATRCHPVSDCQMDKLPIRYARLAQFIPSILHMIEIYLIAQELRDTILAPVGFEDLSLILTAISSSQAREATSYQRLEFYGDCMLKLQTCLQLAATNPIWHEDLLSRHKDRLVSNGRLSKATVEKGLDKFILYKTFTGLKWRPFYNSGLLTAPEAKSTVETSTKVLADVVEAILGATTVDGGHEKALKFLQVLLPEVEWLPYESRIQLLHGQAREEEEGLPPTDVSQIEKMIGYEFHLKNLLVSALTHPSNIGPGQTYQRLEFIGDAVLDSIVVEALFKSPKQIPHYEMHLMRTALVNADFLAFLAMTVSTEVVRGDISLVGSDNGFVATTTFTTQQTGLWKFMRHSGSWDMVNIQQKTRELSRRDMRRIRNLAKISLDTPVPRRRW